MFLGGQTVILGNVTFVIGSVSIVEVIGFSSQSENERKIKIPAVEKPDMTTIVQKTFDSVLAEEM